MLDEKPFVVEILKQATGLEVFYELFKNKATSLPCISYIEIENSARADGDTLRYSNIGFQIKLYSNDLSDNTTYGALIDNAMTEAGYTRSGSNEYSVNEQIIKVINYRGLGKESIGD